MSSIAIRGRIQRSVRGATMTPFRATFSSEWAKLVGLRSTWVLLAFAAVLSVGMTSLLAWAGGWSWDEWTEADKAAFDPLMTSFVGLLFGGVLGVVIAVRQVTNEYSSGMIRLTMQVTPDRRRVLLAKMLSVVAFLAIPMVAITFATILAGQAVLGAYDVPTVEVFSGSTFWTVLGTGVSGVFYPLIAVPLAFMLRSTASSVTALLLLMVFPAMFGGMFPRAIQERVLAWLPGPAVDAVTIGHLDPGYAMYLDWPWAALAIIGWLVGLTLLASRMLNRRDV
jgi:ABC-2 type transport system permease protein